MNVPISAREGGVAVNHTATVPTFGQVQLRGWG